MIQKISVFTFLFFTFWLQAQERCGFDQLHRQQLSNNADFSRSVEDFEQNLIKNFHSFKLKANGSYKVPLVIHVMDAKNALTQITDEQIYAAIKNLNETYRKVAGSHGDGNGVDVTIEFALAVRDPQGKCTNGITRRDMTTNAKYMAAGTTSNTDGISDATLKTFDVWNQTQYYNIWLVSEIDNNNGGSGTQGYAYFSSSHGYSNDGTVILVNVFKNKNDITLPHELGHALNLFHSFEGDQDAQGKSICPVNTNCNTNGDRVCDTPPHIRSKSDCVIGTNTCDGGSSTENFIRNYMDYSSSDCANMFTAGQKTRMLAALTVTRKSFLEENGNLSLIPPATPTIDFTASNTLVCTGSTVDLNARIACVPNSFLVGTVWTNISFQWTLSNGSTILTSTNQNPSFQLTTEGEYDVTLEVKTSFGTQSIVKKSFIIVSQKPKTACMPKSTNVGNFWNCVTNVTLKDINNNSSIYDNIAYSDYSCSSGTILEVGKSYDLSVSIRAADKQEVFEAYIDYNNNGIFEISEKIHEGSTPADAVNAPIVPFKTTLTIPQNAVVNTPLRMRIYGEGNTLIANEKSCNAIMYIGDVEDYAVYIKSTCIGAPSITNQPTTPTATCSGAGTQTLSVTATGGNLSYQWRKGGVNISDNTIYSGATTASLTLTNPTTAEAGNYDVVVTGTCSPTVTSNPVTISVTPSVTPSVSITSSDIDNTFCIGTSVTYTANVSNGGTTPTYQWKNKGVAIQNQTAATYTSNTLANNDQISVDIISNASCKSTANASSNILTISTVTFNPSVSITSSDADNTICPSSPVTFTATPVNAGSVTYQWKLNGNNIANAKASTYNTSVLVNNDVISVALTSLETCASPSVVNSNSITTKVNSLPTASISSGYSVCKNANSTPLAVTGANGSAPYSFTYTVNNGQTQTLNTPNTIFPGSTTVGTYVFKILTVSDANNCKSTLNNLTSTINVIALTAPVITCGITTNHAITYNWSAMAGASSYNISYVEGTNTSVNGGSTSNLNYTVTNINPTTAIALTVLPVGTGCYAAAIKSCTTDNSAGIDSQTTSNIRVFPNPSAGKITIEGIPMGYSTLELVDHAGRIISKKAIKNDEFTEEYRDIAPGIYLLKFSGDSQTSFTKSIEIQ